MTLTDAGDGDGDGGEQNIINISQKTKLLTTNIRSICFPPKGILTDAGDGDGGHIKRQPKKKIL